jgi:hypothetical protein
MSNLKGKNKMKGASSEREGEKKLLQVKRKKKWYMKEPTCIVPFNKNPKGHPSYIVHNENPKHQYNENH